jgi:hypothetical protein
VNPLSQDQPPEAQDGDAIAQRLRALAPERPPRSVDRQKVRTYLPAILTARKNGNSWAQIAQIVGMKADALRKAVQHFTAGNAASPTVATLITSAREALPSSTTRAPNKSPQPPGVRAAGPPPTHAGLRRKDARI